MDDPTPPERIGVHHRCIPAPPLAVTKSEERDLESARLFYQALMQLYSRYPHWFENGEPQPKEDVR